MTDEAAALFEQSLALNRRINDKGMARAELQNLGLVEIHRGNTDAAERYAESERLGPANDPYSTAMANLYRGFIAFVRGNTDESRAYCCALNPYSRRPRWTRAPDDQFEINWLQVHLERNVRD